MKNKKLVIAIALTVAVVLGLSIVSVQAYTDYRHEQDIKQVERDVKRAMIVEREQRKEAAYFERMYQGCITGQKIYDASTSVVRAKQTRPVCE